MKKFTKRILSTFVALMMVFSLLPAAAFAAEGDVAKIGDTGYATLDAAISAAEDGATIELLQDCEVQWTTANYINKSLTFTGNYTITMDTYGFGLAAGKTLRFDECKVVLQDVSYSHNGDGQLNWGAIILSRDTTLELDNGAKMKIVGGNKEANTNAIYASANSKINISNNSTLTLDNCKGGGIQWDGATCYLNITGNSYYIVQNGCYSGMAGTAEITVTDSTMSVTDCTGNGSNGSDYTIDNSYVEFKNNGSWGISANEIEMTNGSTLIATGNERSGVWTRALNVDSTCTLTVEKNGYGFESDMSDFETSGSFGGSTGATSNAGITFWGKSGVPSKIEAGANVTIRNNAGSGISALQGICDLTMLSGNITNNGAESAVYGGGIFSIGTITLGPDVVLYNNHASKAGDDIYSAPTADTKSISFYKVGSDWVLDDCDHIIDGWYDDSANARWEAHAETAEGNHIQEVAAGTLNGVYALKAAHGENAQDKTSYPGLEKKVEDKNGNWGDSTTSADNQSVSFKLTSNVPDDLLNWIKPDEAGEPGVVTPTDTLAINPVENRGEYNLVIHDKMDEAFVTPGSFVVTLDREGTDNDEELNNTQYTLTNPGTDGCTFDITIDLAALYEAGVVTEADITNATPIVVTYTATLKEGTTAGTYKNASWVTAPGGWKTAVDEVTVDTYAINIFKYDQSTADEAPLSGAVFTLYGSDGTTVLDTATSGNDGFAIFDGLDVGTYYVKETEAPDGYVGSEQELPVVIPDKAGTNNIANVKFANSPVPHTGGMGTAMFTVGGAAILAVAGALFVTTRRKAEN